VAGVHDVRAAEDARQGEAHGDRLRDADEIGVDAVVLRREEPSRARKARLHLVHDEEDPVAVADPAQARHELGRRDDEPALSLHGLDDDRRDVLGLDLHDERVLERVERGGRRDPAVLVRERHPVHLGHERAEPLLVRVRLRGEGERQERPAVEGALERDHRLPLRREAGELDRVLDRLRPGVEERRLDRPGDGREPREALGERDVELVGHDGEVGVAEALELLLRRGDDVGMRMADVQAADAAGEVDEGVPVDVGQRRAARGFRHHRERDGERRGDCMPQPGRDRARARARDLRAQLDRPRGGHRSERSCENRFVVLSDRTIARLLAEGRIEIDPYDAALLQPSSVDVRVDRYFRVFRNNLYPFIDVKRAQEDLTELVEVDGEPFILHAGEFVLGSTLERVRLPEDIVGRLDGKSSLGRLGLLIHSTAGFIDPGWDGHVTLELSNVANLPITIYPEMKIGQLSFVQMTEPAEAPYGSGAIGSKYQGQKGPTPSRYYKNFE